MSILPSGVPRCSTAARGSPAATGRTPLPPPLLLPYPSSPSSGRRDRANTPPNAAFVTLSLLPSFRPPRPPQAAFFFAPRLDERFPSAKVEMISLHLRGL